MHLNLLLQERADDFKGGPFPGVGWNLHLPVPLRPGMFVFGSLIRNKLRRGLAALSVCRVANTKQIEMGVPPSQLQGSLTRNKLRRGFAALSVWEIANTKQIETWVRRPLNSKGRQYEANRDPVSLSLFRGSLIRNKLT